jgi:hypothetical protein
MSTRIVKAFLMSVAAVLAVTAAAKLYSATGTARILSLEDPILHVNNRLLLAVMGAVETLLAVCLWRMRGREDQTRPTLAVLWLASNFIAYRLAIHIMDVTVCPCLGTLGAKLPLPPVVVNDLLTAFVLYCAAGSACLLYFAQPGGWVRPEEAECGAPSPASVGAPSQPAETR